MSLIMKIAGADFSDSGLPKLKRAVFGFPAEGLAGLYLFEDGTVDTAHIGAFTDSSGRKNDAALFSDFSPPVNRSYGVEVTDGAGLIMNTGIKQPSNFTILVCANLTMDPDLLGGYPTYTGDTGNSIPATKASNGGNTPRLVINASLTGSESDTNGLYSNASLYTAGVSRVAVNKAAYGGANQPAILALSVVGDVVNFRSLSGFKSEYTDSDITPAYASVDRDMVLGLWSHGAPGNLSGRLYGFAVYERGLDDVEMTEAMEAMNTRVSARGVTVVS